MNPSLFSNLLFVDECLFDSERIKAFKLAIEKIIKSHHIVLDAGTGTGIFGMIAAKSGAKKVIAVDIDPQLVEIAKLNASNNNLENMNFKVADLTRDTLEDSFDVVLMEILDTGMIAESQAQIINSLHKNKVLREDSIMLPNKMESFIELINYDFNLYGFKFLMPLQARNFGVNTGVKKVFSKPISYERVDFKKTVDIKVDSTISIEVQEEGMINAIRLTSALDLLINTKIGPTTDMNMPAILPTRELNVRPGDIVKININYYRGAGFGNVKLIFN